MTSITVEIKLTEDMIATEWVIIPLQEGWTVGDLKNEVYRRLIVGGTEVPPIDETALSTHDHYPDESLTLNEAITNAEESLIEREVKANERKMKEIFESLTVPRMTEDEIAAAATVSRNRIVRALQQERAHWLDDVGNDGTGSMWKLIKLSLLNGGGVSHIRRKSKKRKSKKIKSKKRKSKRRRKSKRI